LQMQILSQSYISASLPLSDCSGAAIRPEEIIVIRIDLP